MEFGLKIRGMKAIHFIFLSLLLGSFGCSNQTVEHTAWSEWVQTVPLAEADSGFEITAGTVIMVGGRTEGTVVDFAARQLQSYLSQMLAAEVPIQLIKEGTSLGASNQKVIVLGQNTLTDQLGISLDEAPSDGFIIRAASNYLAIVGRDGLEPYDAKGTRVVLEAGTLHGVNTLLDQLGFRSFFEFDGLETFPDGNALIVPYSEYRDAPYFPLHLVYGRSKSWTTCVRGGGKKSVYDAHTFKQWPEQFGQSKPDWFLKEDIGVGNFYIDFDKSEVREKILSMGRDHFDSGMDYYDLIQNDGFFYNREHYSGTGVEHEDYLSLHSDLMTINFIDMAEELYKSHPNNKVVLCAYDSYSMPPEGLKELPPNVVVHVAFRRRNNVLEEGMLENRNLLHAWLDLEPSEIYWWEYFGLGKKPWFNEDYELFPRFIPHTIAEDIRYLGELRKENSALQGEWLFHNYREDELNGWWCTPNAYVIGKLLWNPFQDVDALLDDFYQNAFGAASIEMAEFYALCEAAWMEGARLCVDQNPPDFLKDKRNVAWGRAMGHHYFDIHFEREDFLPAWPDSVVSRLNELLVKATEKVDGTPHRKQVQYVVDGYDAFQDLLN